MKIGPIRVSTVVVLPLKMVDKSTSPFQAHFGRVFSPVDSPDRHLTLA
jgi:hypothetical protein